MNEDAQPNERSLNRKGGPIPILRSTRSKGTGTFFRRDGRDVSTRYQKPFNASSSRPNLLETSQNRQQYLNLPCRPQSYVHEESRPTWKRIEPNSNHPPQFSSFSKSKARKPRNKSKKEKKESIELLIDIPHDCQIGVPGFRHARKRWQERQAQELSGKTGVQLRFGGYQEGYARFVLDEKRVSSAAVEENSHEQANNSDIALTSV